MANRSDREPGHPAVCPGRHSPRSRVGPSSRMPSGPAVNMNDCIDRPDTRLHPTSASEAQFATCNAGANQTRRVAPSRANIWSSLVAALNGRRCLRQCPILRATVAPPDAADALIAAPRRGVGVRVGRRAAPLKVTPQSRLVRTQRGGSASALSRRRSQPAAVAAQAALEQG
jgi:hypothetical protein